MLGRQTTDAHGQGETEFLPSAENLTRKEPIVASFAVLILLF